MYICIYIYIYCTTILPENRRIMKDKQKTSHSLNKSFTHFTKTLKLKKASFALKNKPLTHLLKQIKNQFIKEIQKHFD